MLDAQVLKTDPCDPEVVKRKATYYPQSQNSKAEQIRISLRSGFTPREAAALAGTSTRYAVMVRHRAKDLCTVQTQNREICNLRERVRSIEQILEMLTGSGPGIPALTQLRAPATELKLKRKVWTA